MSQRPELETAELQRYSRQLVLPDVGEAGQRRLKETRVLLVGAGGLGSPAALYLAAAGVGTIGIVDADRVETSNLHRQLLHGASDVGRLKVDSARDRIEALNPHVTVETHPVRVTSANGLDLLREYDIIVDGTDNFQTRYLTNDACVLLGKPNVFGSVFRFEGQASVFAVPGGPCYRCLFREPPPPGAVPTCEQAGVLGVLPGMIGMIQATETIKLALGLGDTLSGRLLLVDALRMRFRTIEVRPDPTCPACGTREIGELQDYDAFCGVAPATHGAPGASDGGTEDDDGVPEIAPRALAAWLSRDDAPALLDVREPYEHRIARLEGAELVPLGEVPEAAGRLDRERDLVVYCHHGMRSRAAAEYLRRQGYRRVHNLTGGIDRWSLEVDSTIPRY
ncbi:MAG TPA: molybdopterin-synthase adenylyltransferase MoeB [Gemmatimonadaceae bacterium]|nr:molybdopterin-synthase adenylyltransferase MoeB [Gemmatimonadaceae bacterium]